MAYFLTIREGDAPADSIPILVSADEQIIPLVANAIARKLAPNVDVRPLRSTLKAKEPPPSEE